MPSAYPSPGVLGLVCLFSGMVTAALWRAITYPFRSDCASTFHKDVFFAALRTMLHRITIAQSRYLSPSTTTTYLNFCKEKTLGPVTLRCSREDGTTVLAHWIGSPDAEVVVLYLHGGGYTQPATAGYCHYWHHLTEVSNALGKARSASALLLEYSLAPYERFPIQLTEVVAVLLELINERRRSPSTIILSGDSAGGGLALSLLSHLLHPHPEVRPIKLSGPLCGALLFSPWVSFQTDHDSVTRNANKDMIVPTMLRRWAAMYLDKSNEDPETDPGAVHGDSYSEPASNDATWWEGMHRIVSDVFVWSGGDEVFADPIKDFGVGFKKGWTEGGGEAERALFVETPRRSHIEPIMGFMIDRQKNGDDQEAVEVWLNGRLEK
ncbi:alpha/beta-hydrolase [Lindgomyces ingoldianus]|uniref:Alpha/beta-hydrolase n=1 Tax=Lindgomyces ingoldianus TaxID=673940 RepID=A0ACB6R9A5_9PLEO|nr:alpha/beta-hydrolase [Lindgomyces ingoldianus]KAF2475909.1 alpha/beta-hydrolase [Lindgomyces ingoldianus]